MLNAADGFPDREEPGSPPEMDVRGLGVPVVGTVVASWQVSVERDVQAWLLLHRAAWVPLELDEDTVVGVMCEAIGAVLTEARVRHLVWGFPEILGLPSPGAIAPTLLGVIRDTLIGEMEHPIEVWMNEHSGQPTPENSADGKTG